MLDFAGTVLTAALMTFIINALVTYLDIGHGMKLGIAGIAGFWIGLAAAAGASGWLAISRPFPVIGIFVVTPLLAAAITATSPAARAALLALPTRLLIGLNIARVVGMLFLPLAMEGRLAGPFPYSAGCLCGHLHRAIDCRFAGTVAGTAPSTGAQLRLDLTAEAPLRFMHEPPGYQLHMWHKDSGLVPHGGVRRVAGPPSVTRGVIAARARS